MLNPTAPAPKPGTRSIPTWWRRSPTISSITGKIARDLNIIFLVEFGAHNLADLVRYAWQQQAPNRHKLLERCLHFDTRTRTPLPGVKKAQAILASFFLMRGDAEPVELIQESFRELDPAFVNMIRDDLFNPLHGAIPRSVLRDRSVSFSFRYPVACCGVVYCTAREILGGERRPAHQY